MKKEDAGEEEGVDDDAGAARAAVRREGRRAAGVVEPSGIEPLASSLRTTRSTN